MALTTTVAGTSSDSYCTLVEADAILAFKQSDTWTNATDAVKESALKAAVWYIDELPYQYAKSDSTQALRFPTVQNYEDGAYFVPDRVKRAQALLALHLLNDPDLFSGDDDVKQVSVPGAFSVTSGGTSDGGPLDFDMPREVVDMLSRYLWTSGPIYREWVSARRGWV